VLDTTHDKSVKSFCKNSWLWFELGTIYSSFKILPEWLLLPPNRKL